MKFELKAEMEDGEILECSGDARDIRAWEATFKATMVGQPMSFTYITQLCFVSLRRNGKLDARYPTYEHFDRACVNVDMTSVNGQQELVADPTPSEVTDVSSVS